MRLIEGQHNLSKHLTSQVQGMSEACVKGKEPAQPLSLMVVAEAEVATNMNPKEYIMFVNPFQYKQQYLY